MISEFDPSDVVPYSIDQNEIPEMIRSLCELIRSINNWNDLFCTENPDSQREHWIAFRSNLEKILLHLNEIGSRANACRSSLERHTLVDGKALVTVVVGEDGNIETPAKEIHEAVFIGAIANAQTAATYLLQNATKQISSEFGRMDWNAIHDAYPNTETIDRIVVNARVGVVLGFMLLGSTLSRARVLATEAVLVVEVKVPDQPVPSAALKTIAPENRSRPITKRKAATLLGQVGDGTKWLNKCIADGTIRAEKKTRQSYVFDLTDFPEQFWGQLTPTDL